MRDRKRCTYARINTKVLIILILIIAAIIISLFASRQIRRSILSKRSLEAGQAAFEKKDWLSAYQNFQEYLGRNRDDIEILKKYAEARLSIPPIDEKAIFEAITVYRHVIELNYLDNKSYDELARLYTNIGNFEELAYIARKRLEHVPDDKQAPLWLADALVNLNNKEQAQQTLLKLINDLNELSEKHPEYVQTCLRMSKITSSGGTSEEITEALEWLNKAIKYEPESVEALANRAQFYRVTSNIGGLSDKERMELARNDLNAADKYGTENPQVRILSCLEWMAHGEFERADAEIKAVDNLPNEKLIECFLDAQNWMAARFILVSDLAIRRGSAEETVSLADETLTILTENRHRIQILPSAVVIYIAAGKVKDARSCLDEYLDILYTREETTEAKLRSLYLQALVAEAENKPYLVIDILQPFMVNNTFGPELWRLLANAYYRTNQSRRAVNAIVKYLNFFPKDAEMILLLAKQYFSLEDWDKAYETATTAESLIPDDIVVQILRIESGIRVATRQLNNPDKAALENFSEELTKLRLEHPDKVDIRILQAAIADCLGQPEKAEKELVLAIADCNNTMNAEIQLANLYKRNERMPEAIKICETACQKHPDSAEPWLSLSDLYSANSNYDLARNCLKQGLDSVTANEDKRAISIKLALLEILRADRTAGIQLLRDLVEEDANNIQARLLLLGIREVQEDPAEVDKLVSQLRQIEGPTGLWWRLQQAGMWLSSEQWRLRQQDIIDLLQYCISADPGWSAPILLMGDLYKKQGNLRRTEDIYRQALALNPSTSDITNQLLLLLESQGRFSDAEKILQQADTNRRLFSAWQVRMALKAGEIDRAINELKLRVSNDKKDSISRIQLARLIYQQTRDVTRAFEYLKEAQTINPDSAAVPGMKAAILKAEGRGEEAIKIINEYVETHNDFDAYRMRGLYLATEGEYELAEKDYRKLTTLEGAGPKSYELLSIFFAEIKNLDKAISAIEEGLRKYPADLSLERRLMQLLVIQGPTRDLDRANEILKELEDKLPQDSELMKFKAALLLENPTSQSIDAARETLEKIIKLEPTAVDVCLMLVNIAIREKKYDIARDYVTKCMGTNANNPELMIARSRIELAAGNLQMAAELANLILKKYPDNQEARNIFIVAALNSSNEGFLKEARMLVESALVRSPKDEKLLIARANILISLDMSNIAIPDLEDYCLTEPGSSNVSALVTLAELYRTSGDMSKAEQKINQAASIDPNNLSVIHSRFLLLISQKKFEALSDISSAYISAKAQNPKLLLNAANILVSLDSQRLKEEGLKLFERAAVLSPDSIDENFGLASSLYHMGYIERAERIYRELLEKFPNNVRVLNDLAWILQENYQNDEEALELVNKGLKFAPDDMHLLDTRGTILSKSTSQLNEAKKDFERIVELSPSNSKQQARALLKLGRVYFMLNDLIEAKKYLGRALEIDQKLGIFTPAEREEIIGIIQ